MLKMTQRGKHYNFVWCSTWLKEANTAILCEGEVDTERQTLSYCIMTMGMTQRQTLPSRVVLNMTQRGTLCLVWCWIRPRGKHRWKHVKRWWEGCSGVVSTNSDITERERGKKKSVGFRTDYSLCPVGSCSAGGLLPLYPAKYIQRKKLTNCLSRQEPDVWLFWWL